MDRFARIVERIAMDVTLGLDGMEKTWQSPFPPTTPCCRCGGESRIAFVAHEGIESDENPPYGRVWQLRPNGGEGDYWLHDNCAVTVYLCRNCLEPTVLYNQA